MKKNLDDISAEIHGISDSLHIIGMTFAEQSINPALYQTSLFALAEHLERITHELETAHMNLEVRPQL